MREITQAELKEKMKYDPETGEFLRFRKMKKIWVKSGTVSGIRKKYVYMTINNQPYRAHRLAWLFLYGKWPDGQIDHIDGDGTNNKLSNLRDVTASENQKNRKLSKGNISGYNGVYLNRRYGTWGASIKTANKLIYLGHYLDKEDAIKARKLANEKYGFHPNHGIVRPH